MKKIWTPPFFSKILQTQPPPPPPPPFIQGGLWGGGRVWFQLLIKTSRCSQCMIQHFVSSMYLFAGYLFLVFLTFEPWASKCLLRFVWTGQLGTPINRIFSTHSQSTNNKNILVQKSSLPFLSMFWSSVIDSLNFYHPFVVFFLFDLLIFCFLLFVLFLSLFIFPERNWNWSRKINKS